MMFERERHGDEGGNNVVENNVIDENNVVGNNVSQSDVVLENNVGQNCVNEVSNVDGGLTSESFRRSSDSPFQQRPHYLQHMQQRQLQPNHPQQQTILEQQYQNGTLPEQQLLPQQQQQQQHQLPHQQSQQPQQQSMCSLLRRTSSLAAFSPLEMSPTQINVDDDEEDDEDDENELRPVKQSFCGSLARDTHWKCLILTLLLFGCGAAILWCRIAVVTRYVIDWRSIDFSRIPEEKQISGSPCDEGYLYIPVAFVVMLYLVYLVECYNCHTRSQLLFPVDVKSVYAQVRLMRSALPVCWWRAVCYHYVRRTRQVTRYRNGDSFTTTQVYYERVNSLTTGSAFDFSDCGVKDISPKLVGLESFPLTKIRFSRGFTFASLESEMEFENQRTNFFLENERRDDYMDTREGMDLLNVQFREYVIAFKDKNQLPWYISHVIFWIASSLLLSWPLRVLIEYKTAYIHYQVNKLFGTNHFPVHSSGEEANADRSSGRTSGRGSGHPHSPAQYTALEGGGISRVTTMTSQDLDNNYDNNNFVVPSYSQAIFMKNANRDTGDDDDAAVHRSVSLNCYNQTTSSPVLHRFTSLSTIRSLHQDCLRGLDVLQKHKQKKKKKKKKKNKN